MIKFASWWSIREINNQNVSMLGRDAHMISSIIVNLFAISYVNSYVHLFATIILDSVHVWNYEPRSTLNHKKHLSNTI